MARKLILTVAIMLLAAMPAFAASIDFSNPAIGSQFNNQHSQRILLEPGVYLRLSAFKVSWNGAVGGSVYNITSDTEDLNYGGWRTPTDRGIGVSTPSTAYEVGPYDMLEISFEDEAGGASPVILSSVSLGLFFSNEDGGREDGFYGLNQVNNGQLIRFFAEQPIRNPQTDGQKTLQIGQSVTSIQLFGGLGDPSTLRNSEFNLQGVEASATPEPGSMLLLGSGLAGLVALRRRRRRQ